MVGLIWQETLTLSSSQHLTLCLGFLAAIWLWCAQVSLRDFALGSFLCLLAVWSQWPGLWICRDTIIPADHQQALSSVPWRDFLTQTNQTTYLKLQPPLWALWWRIMPSWLWQQACCVAWAWTGLLAYRVVYGQTSACFLLASPLFLLMSVQPLNEWPLWWCTVLGMASHCSLLGLSVGCLWKALGYAWIPWAWMVSRKRFRKSLLFVGMQAGYWAWLWSSALGKRQARALCAWGSGHAVKFTAGQMSPGTVRWGWRLWKRVRKMSQKSGGAWMWYLFPFWTRATWGFWGMLVFLLVGQGNVKYFLLLSLLVDKTDRIWYTTENPTINP